ncbi:MAG: DNA-3-methyladenine glycosylase I [Micavibrio sp.]|nr:DNA-3-methyladenine glycosylase I [Micavibrio sp.]|tara:strand:- start:817773 stop:818384 length:612 start_codon:yes stop_codon:yes gene_type:complete
MNAPKGIIIGDDGKSRCAWCGDDPLYVHYHDSEWGVETKDDKRLYEKMCLEGFQAGLSWLTILKKRENFRRAFADFDFYKVAQFDESKVEELLQDEGIIRHRGKIEAAIHNAKLVPELIKEHGSLWHYFIQFRPSSENRPNPVSYEEVQKLAITEESRKLAKDLKKRGFKFLGPTTMYAHMQAMGLVNDHLENCDFRKIGKDI